MTNIDTKTLNGPRVAVIAYDRLCHFEFGIAAEVFGLSRPEFGNDWYNFEVISAEGETLSAVGGVTYHVERGLDALKNADIIILPGWREPYTDVPQSLITALKDAYENGARIVAICGGAYVLAATGLLTGKSATTHWRFINDFVGNFPDINVDNAPLYCEESNLYTSAGSAAGIDLCLHVVQQDYGLEKANIVAKRLVVSPVRAGAQKQEITQPILPQNKHQKLPQILNDIRANISETMTIEQAASNAGLSPRTFTRQFQKITGTSYGEWIKIQKLERAKSLLLETDLPIDIVAEACGYASGSSLRRLFKEMLGHSPLFYRKNSTVPAN
ncbi:helix-turn-helix domain-containing protein [Pseudemcibacter aquimaris]|uniref:helix-turn-helix domain-containing protein n=1 Tax=Pseudemcibacter aquimaris TaxID=2857064 RepID=UPI002012F68A|nr:helix-turn-helix domain-containing protein [Pseudemcibacter aquimaris]MCC3859885.1 helix-turn-helix domain-containing protein [Pseudemcibacter aquimaris]WDU57217.1 helix-turn-helix domain-containing protein [Pseudemcibacter aquimaris]